MLPSIEQRIANELGVSPRQVLAAVQLLDEGATVPFIARYRKEVTGALDDTQLRTLEERLGYLRELEERRTTVLSSIEEQGKLTAELRETIENADTKQRLEDLYLPYKQKRRTKAQIAREAGIAPLAEALIGWFKKNDAESLASYSKRALSRVWKSERFSWSLTMLLHRFPTDGAFDQRMQVAELDYIASSEAAQTAIAENYVGLPL